MVVALVPYHSAAVADKGSVLGGVSMGGLVGEHPEQEQDRVARRNEQLPRGHARRMAMHVKQLANRIQPDCTAARHRILALLDAPQRLANL